MSKRYPGNFITGNPVAVSQTSNNGIWDLKDQYQATGNNTWQEGDGIYEIGRSLRFKSASGAYLTKSFATDGNRKTWTWSFWVKRGKLASDQHLWSSAGASHPGGADIAYIGFTGDDRFVHYMYPNGGPAAYYVGTSRVFRDPSAWYHIVLRHNTSASTTNDRVKIYVNGIEEVNLSNISYPSLDYASSYINSTRPQVIGHEDGRWRYPIDGYMAESNFIDGQALDPSYFGYTDSITGIWYPKKYTGAYGTNGFYLPFSEPVATSGTINGQNVGRNFAGGTNYVRYSEDGSQTSYGWVIERATVATNSTVAPDGTTTANKLTCDGTANNTHRTYCGTVATPSGSTQTASIYLKYNNCRYINIENWNGSDYQTQTFDILNGVAVTGFQTAVGFTSQFVGNGWYRVSVPLYAGSANTGGPSIAIYLLDASGNVTWNGDSTSSVYYWGAQINLGTTADPYLRTASSTTITSHWSPNGISVSAGTTYDLMVDSPTNIFTTATDIGGVVSGNYPTWNPINNLPSSASNTSTFASANLQLSSSAGEGSGNSSALGTMQIPSTGKWYWEVTITGRATLAASRSQIGIMKASAYYTNSLDVVYNTTSNAVYAYSGDGSKAYSYGNFVSYGGAWTNGDVIGVACDWDAGTLTFYKNGISQGVAFTGLSGSDNYFPVAGYFGTFNINFGQRPFAHTPPTGFKTLNTTNLQSLGITAVGNAAIQANKWFDITLYGGTGAPRTVENSGFQPDMIWIKSRNAGQWHNITDSVRGAGAEIFTNATNAEETNGGISSINSNGFSLINWDGANNETDSYVAWQWKQSPTAGLNIVSWTGDGTNNRAISHNLGVVPAMIIVKDRTVGYNWDIYHQSLGISATMIFSNSIGTRNVSAFGSTAPTSSNFYTQNSYTNTSGSRLIAYVFAEVPGFSKFGSFSGNGASDGPFIYTGFRPRFFMYKAHSHSSDWWLLDATRSSINVAGNYVFPNAASSEGVESTWIDFLSNGIKIRGRTDPNTNGSDRSYVYMAFAESPFGLNNRAR